MVVGGGGEEKFFRCCLVLLIGESVKANGAKGDKDRFELKSRISTKNIFSQKKADRDRVFDVCRRRLIRSTK